MPFDEDGKLKAYFQKSFESKELIIIDKVFDECLVTAQGIIVKNLDFILLRTQLIVNTDDTLPYPKFFTQLDNQFCEKDILKSKNIDSVEFERKKQEYVNDADGKMILYARERINESNLFPQKTVIITEETKRSNDGKVIKKIPAICEILKIECCTLPDLIKEHYSLKLGDFLSKTSLQ